VIWSNGRPTNLGFLPNPSNPFLSNFSLGQALNDRDEVVGWSSQTINSLDFNRATLWKAGKIIHLGTLPNYLASEARAINNTGQIVGFCSRSTSGAGERAFSWENGAMLNLGTLGGTAAIAYDINDAAQIVGKSYVAGNAATHTPSSIRTVS
jgi:probable HAF family extracellular repeat protein